MNKTEARIHTVPFYDDSTEDLSLERVVSVLEEDGAADVKHLRQSMYRNACFVVFSPALIPHNIGVKDTPQQVSCLSSNMLSAPSANTFL